MPGVKRAKRALSTEGRGTKRRPDARPTQDMEMEEDVQFEDDFEDEFVPEEVYEGRSDDEDEEMEEDKPVRIWRPGVDELAEDEELQVAPGAYDMLHRGEVEWPCLTFDIVPDKLGAQRSKYPLTAYVMSGTEADRADRNAIFIMKWYHLHKTAKDDDMEASSDSESSMEDQDAAVEFRRVPHPGVVNRLRIMPQVSNIVATWSDSGAVHMWDVRNELLAIDREGWAEPEKQKPLQSFQHSTEGFAMAFSPHKETVGRFISGDCAGKIHLWEPREGGWDVDPQAFEGHSDSVEDVQFRPQGDQSVFVSASADRTVRVWDIRTGKTPVEVLQAHDADVNVLALNPKMSDLLLTGSDDGCFKVFDLRGLGSGALANFRWHTKAITSVGWHPTDDTCLAVSSADNTLSIWDMAVEDDSAGIEKPEGADHFPPQLLFLHQGQTDIKELKWHPQIPGVIVSTASDGFNIFRTSNI
mmetsp:Transcript_21295/g.51543  ORF Transcript_21295/g.51543 Transcript_21295/m.51543 type:complete len:470 (-) Transcript_21295:83-1492(-)